MAGAPGLHPGPCLTSWAHRRQKGRRHTVSTGPQVQPPQSSARCTNSQSRVSWAQRPHGGVSGSCLAPKAPHTVKSKVHTNIYSVPTHGERQLPPGQRPRGLGRPGPGDCLGSEVGEPWWAAASSRSYPTRQGRHPRPTGLTMWGLAPGSQWHQGWTPQLRRCAGQQV